MSEAYLGKSLSNVGEKSGQIGWRSPSNIALIKYWGKHGNQLPQNPSISFTLSNAFTETIVKYATHSRGTIDIAFTFEGKANASFENRISAFLNKNISYFPFVNSLSLSIESNNSFPHSSGIASSASAMSALCLCMVSLEQHLTEAVFSQSEFLQKSSFLSRLASGSASRSVYPSASIWGQHSLAPGSSDLYAIAYEELHPIFATMHDDILIVSKAKKSVSSTAGHNLMKDNVFASARYEQARTRFSKLLPALQSGDLDLFGKILEDEALTLHALMMCSDPSYILIEPNTLALIQRIRAYRYEQKIPVYFTLDAGPNIHLLYPDDVRTQVQTFIQEELRQHCEDGRIIEDYIGTGPARIDSLTLTSS